MESRCEADTSEKRQVDGVAAAAAGAAAGVTWQQQAERRRRVKSLLHRAAAGGGTTSLHTEERREGRGETNKATQKGEGGEGRGDEKKKLPPGELVSPRSLHSFPRFVCRRGAERVQRTSERARESAQESEATELRALPQPSQRQTHSARQRGLALALPL